MIEEMAEYPVMQPGFANTALQETGVAGGLKKLGVNAPNVQYNMMFHRIL